MTSRRAAAATAVAAVVALAAACGADDEPGADPAPVTVPPTEAAATPPTVATTATSPTTATNPTTEESTMTTIPTPDATQDPVARAAVADLARRLDVAADEIGVASLERGVWNDGSIGCPEPGMAYTEALVPGVRVALVHDGVTYWYHQGGPGEVFWCAAPAAGAFRGSAGDELVPPPGYTD